MAPSIAWTLSPVANERQDDWDQHVPHRGTAYNNSVSSETDLAPKEVCLVRLVR